MPAAKPKPCIDISLDGVGEASTGRRRPIRSGTKASRIDISLDGVGGAPAVRQSRSRIDIPLDSGRTPAEESRRISALELELVNRHHAEVKELYRRAEKGE